MRGSLGFQVNLSAKAFAAALASRLPAGMTTAQMAVLSLLTDHPGASQREIAAATGIDTATLAEMLKRLEARGVVTREPDPNDARRLLVRVGDLGPGDLATALEAAHDVNERAMAGLSDDERRMLIPLLERLRTNLEAS